MAFCYFLNGIFSCLSLPFLLGAVVAPDWIFCQIDANHPSLPFFMDLFDEGQTLAAVRLANSPLPRRPSGLSATRPPSRGPKGLLGVWAGMDKIGELQSLRRSGVGTRPSPQTVGGHESTESTWTSVRRPSSTLFFSFRPYFLITASPFLQALGKYQVLARIETGVRCTSGPR